VVVPLRVGLASVRFNPGALTRSRGLMTGDGGVLKVAGVEPLGVPEARWWPPRGAVADGLLAVVLGVAAFSEVLVVDRQVGFEHLAVVAAINITMAAATAWRRRAPLPAVLVGAGAHLSFAAVSVNHEMLVTNAASVLVLAYSVACWAPRTRAVWGLAALAAAGAIGLHGEDATLAASFYLYVQLAAVWGLGRAGRARARQARDAAKGVVRAEEASEQATAAAISGERSQIGRELHDIVSHGLSAMVVLAAAAQAAVLDAPGDAGTSLARLQDVGRRTEREVARLLRLLRRSDDTAATGPAGSEHEAATPPSTHGAPSVPASAWWPPAGVIADRGLAAVAVAATLAEGAAIGMRAPSLSALAAFEAACLAWRRTAPLAALVAGGSAYAIGVHLDPVFDDNSTFYVLLALLFSVAAWARRRDALIGLAITAAAAAAGGESLDAANIGYAVLVIAVPWASGRMLQARLAEIASATKHALRIEHRRARATQLALERDRVRVARELHDVISHGVAVMVVLAIAAQAALTDAPDDAVGALESIQDAGRQAQADLGHLLELLSGDTTDASLEPTPDITDVQALVERVRLAGLPVDLTVEGEPGGAAGGIGLTAYRIIQEALTNVTRHAGPVPTAVHLTYSTDRVCLSVRNHAGRVLDRGSGHGLIGMRERVAVCDGRLTAGPLEEGGYLLAAELPLSP
jgi:signal transduction histidine kinase